MLSRFPVAPTITPLVLQVTWLKAQNLSANVAAATSEGRRGSNSRLSSRGRRQLGRLMTKEAGPGTGQKGKKRSVAHCWHERDRGQSL